MVLNKSVLVLTSEALVKFQRLILKKRVCTHARQQRNPRITINLPFNIII